MTTHYIQTLGVAKCRDILKGMPEWATVFDIDVSDYFRAGATKVTDIKLSDLRAELSAHDSFLMQQSGTTMSKPLSHSDKIEKAKIKRVSRLGGE